MFELILTIALCIIIFMGATVLTLLFYIAFYRNGYVFTRIIEYADDSYSVQCSIIPINFDFIWVDRTIEWNTATNFPTGEMGFDPTSYTIETVPHYRLQDINEFFDARKQLINYKFNSKSKTKPTIHIKNKTIR